jgi:hypothetical protein
VERGTCSERYVGSYCFSAESCHLHVGIEGGRKHETRFYTGQIGCPGISSIGIKKLEAATGSRLRQSVNGIIKRTSGRYQDIYICPIIVKVLFITSI